jgi:iron complex outermembrane receptor protein
VANRAPTPAELSCAGPTNSCSLANFFVGDPDLQQVVSHTVEAGVRGNFAPFGGATLSYNLALFHTNLDNDIAFINSVTQGRAFFANIGQTRRQGVDVGVQLKTDRWMAYVAYTHIDATFQSGFVEASGNNPAADEDGNIIIRKGSQLPGIPANQVKFGAYYKATDKWTVGASAIFASSAFLFGDEANLTPPLPAYFTMDLSTTYQLTDNVQLFAWAQNITNARYYTFGTFSPTSSVFLAQAPGATNPRSFSLAAPIGGYGGARISF